MTETKAKQWCIELTDLPGEPDWDYFGTCEAETLDEAAKTFHDRLRGSFPLEDLKRGVRRYEP